MIDKSDCISITDKTFDLSLDDPLSDASFTAVDSVSDQNLGETTMGGSPPKSKFHTILTDPTVSKFNNSESQQFKGLESRWNLHLPPVNQVNRTTTASGSNGTDSSQKATVTTVTTAPSIETMERLRKSIRQLTRISGNTVGSVSQDMDLTALVEMVSKLTDAAEYKMRFLNKNYSFLESVYDTARRELEGAKAELVRSNKKIRASENELCECAQREVAMRQQLEKKEQNLQETDHAREVIERQQREIKEYKLFIKQMMERDT
ncbi:CYFA0S01e00298g1_1 [Cyberlindnera fabianii]|uniref:CYFA0S01e00298g1_1 n=1 Tax=Cyberlindnera fabianii TaxID=36022 RepID=A0A061AFC9_CYBFA|nr:CYFA0S01e00298g1_1 [Cyberlindnera fabianii]